MAYKPIMWNDIPYRTMKAAADACGITRQAMQQRIAKGYTCDDDMPGGRLESNVDYDGVLDALDNLPANIGYVYIKCGVGDYMSVTQVIRNRARQEGTRVSVCTQRKGLLADVYITRVA